MKRFLGAALAAILFVIPARGDETAANAIVDKGISGLGGAEKLGNDVRIEHGRAAGPAGILEQLG